MENIFLKKGVLLYSLVVTIFLITVFVVIADTNHPFKNIEAIASQRTNFTSVSELVQTGNMLFNNSKFEEAVKWFDKALKIDPKSIDALNGIGLSLNKLGRYEEAITWFDMALRIDPPLH